MNNEFRESVINSRVGAKQLRRWGINAVGRAVSEGEVVLGVLPCASDRLLCATDSRAFVVSRDGVEFESPYGSITKIDVSTGWFSRGISIATSDGGISVETDDRDGVVAMGDIIREMSPRIDAPETEKRKGGGLTGLAKGVFNTATGGDIRKYDEFVDSATTVLVGLHQDQAALSAKLVEFDEAIAELRESDNMSRERLSALEATMAELQTAQSETLANLKTVQDTLNTLADEIREAQSLIQDIQASDNARSSPPASTVKVALMASGVAVAISVVSILLRFM